MAQQYHDGGAETAQAIRAFLSTYDASDASDASDRQIALRIRERLNSELYRRERDQYPQWIDHGGES